MQNQLQSRRHSHTAVAPFFQPHCLPRSINVSSVLLKSNLIRAERARSDQNSSSRRRSKVKESHHTDISGPSGNPSSPISNKPRPPIHSYVHPSFRHRFISEFDEMIPDGPYRKQQHRTLKRGKRMRCLREHKREPGERRREPDANVHRRFP